MNIKYGSIHNSTECLWKANRVYIIVIGVCAGTLARVNLYEIYTDK